MKDTTVFYDDKTLEPDLYTYEEEGKFILDMMPPFDVLNEVYYMNYGDVKKLQLACRRFLERNKQ